MYEGWLGILDRFPPVLRIMSKKKSKSEKSPEDQVVPQQDQASATANNPAQPEPERRDWAAESEEAAALIAAQTQEERSMDVDHLDLGLLEDDPDNLFGENSGNTQNLEEQAKANREVLFGQDLETLNSMRRTNEPVDRPSFLREMRSHLAESQEKEASEKVKKGEPSKAACSTTAASVVIPSAFQSGANGGPTNTTDERASSMSGLVQAYGQMSLHARHEANNRRFWPVMDAFLNGARAPRSPAEARLQAIWKNGEPLIL